MKMQSHEHPVAIQSNPSPSVQINLQMILMTMWRELQMANQRHQLVVFQALARIRTRPDSNSKTRGRARPAHRRRGGASEAEGRRRGGTTGSQIGGWYTRKGKRTGGVVAIR